MTYNVLQSEELLLPSVLRFPREDDLHSLDVSIAQRCLLCSLMSTVTEHPEKLTEMKIAKSQPGPPPPLEADVNGNEVCMNSL